MAPLAESIANNQIFVQANLIIIFSFWISFILDLLRQKKFWWPSFSSLKDVSVAHKNTTIVFAALLIFMVSINKVRSKN